MKISTNEKVKDLEWALGLNRLSLNFYGVWPGIPINLDFRRKYLRLSLVILTMIVTLFIPQMYAMYYVRRDLPLVVDNMMTSIVTALSALKLLVFWIRQKDLVSILLSMASDWKDARSDSDREMMIMEAQRGRSFTIYGFLIMFGNFCSFIIFPFFGLTYRVISNITDIGDRLLVVQSVYPYSYNKTPYYELTYTSQAIGAFCVTMALSTLDTFFPVLVFHICGQLRILSNNIRKLPEQDYQQEMRNGPESEWNYWTNLGKLVDKHVHIIGLVEKVESLYTLLIFFQVLTMSAAICCVGFEILNGISSSGTMPIMQLTFLFGSLSAGLLHMYIYCAAAEHLMVQGQEVNRSAYSGSWYFLQSKKISAFFPIMVRAQLPLRISAGKFVYMSLETFANILKSTISYLSVLLTVAQ